MGFWDFLKTDHSDKIAMSEDGRMYLTTVHEPESDDDVMFGPTGGWSSKWVYSWHTKLNKFVVNVDDHGFVIVGVYPKSQGMQPKLARRLQRRLDDGTIPEHLVESAKEIIGRYINAAS